MTLGELALNIEITEEEKLRISKILENKESLPFTILKKYAIKNEQFRKLSRVGYKKQINGFRVGTDYYYSQALTLLLKNLSQNNAREIEWDVYQSVVIEYLNHEKPSFQELMHDIKVEPETEGTTEFVFQNIFENSYAYDIEMSDIENVYEAWPFPRIDNYKELSTKLNNPDLPIRNKRLLKETEKRLEDLKNNIEERQSLAENNKSSINEINYILSNIKDEISTDVDNKINTLEEKLFSEINLIKEAQEKQHTESITENNNLIKKINNIESLLSLYTTKDEFQNNIKSTSNYIDSSIQGVQDILKTHKENLENYVDAPKCNLKTENIINLIKKTKVEINNDVLTNVVEKIGNNDNIFFNKYLQTNIKTENKNEINIGEQAFLESFSSRLNMYSVSQSDIETLVQHTIMKDSSVIYINDRRIYSAWIESLGWEEYITKISISPNWSSPNDWGEEILKITSDIQQGPHFIEIHNFDVGLFEAYLVPILKLLQERGESNPTRKVILLPSNQNIFYNVLSISEYSRCVDTFHNESTLNKDIGYVIGSSNLRHQGNNSRVSQKSLTSWIKQITKIDNPLSEKFIIDCRKVFEENQTDFPFNIYSGVPETISRNKHLLNGHREMYETFVQAFTAPWISLASEVKNHAN